MEVKVEIPKLTSVDVFRKEIIMKNIGDNNEKYNWIFIK